MSKVEIGCEEGAINGADKKGARDLHSAQMSENSRWLYKAVCVNKHYALVQGPFNLSPARNEAATKQSARGINTRRDK
jgi:hypothetical protein